MDSSSRAGVSRSIGIGLEVAGLVLVAVYDSAVGSVLQLEIRWGIRPGEMQQHAYEVGRVMAASALAVWLGILVYARVRSGKTRAGWIAAPVGMAAVYGTVLHGNPQVVNVLRLFHSVALAWLVFEIAARHGITRRALLTARRARSARERTQGRVQAFYAFVMVFLSCYVSGTLLFKLYIAYVAPVLGEPGALGKMQREMLHVYTPSDFFTGLVGALVLEDLVVVAATVALLRLARFPMWAVYAIVCTLEALLYVYTGLFASLVMMPYAISRTYLYNRFGRIIPLAMGHAAWDSIGVATWVVDPAIGRYLLSVAFAIMVIVTLIWYKSSPEAKKSFDGLARRKLPTSLECSAEK